MLVPSHYFVHPTYSFTAGSALTTRFMLIKTDETGNSFNDIGLFVHDDHSCSAKGTLCSDKIIKVQ